MGLLDHIVLGPGTLLAWYLVPFFLLLFLCFVFMSLALLNLCPSPSKVDGTGVVGPVARHLPGGFGLYPSYDFTSYQSMKSESFSETRLLKAGSQEGRRPD